MPQIDLFLEVILTIVFGAILGLETETRQKEIKGKKIVEKERIGGVRTFVIICLFGGIAGIFFAMGQFILVYILFFAVIALTIAAYILNVQIKHAFGLTTELAVLIAFVIGFFTTSKLIPLWLIISILVILVFFLSQKRGISSLINQIEHKEVIDVIKFALVSIVVLPILPNTNIKIIDISSALNIPISNPQIESITLINPFSLWLIVVLISGINLFGYFLSRIFGTKRGLLLTAVISGLISSTSATISFASRSKGKLNKGNSMALAGAASIANAVSFITIGLLILVSNRELFNKSIAILMLMFVSGIIIGLVLLYKDKGKVNGEFTIKYEPFSVFPALKFVSIILLITIGIQFLQLFKVDQILVVGITAISGITGMDAATIAFANISKDGLISIQIAIISLLAANAINFFAKYIYSRLTGSKEYSNKLAIALTLTAIIGLLGLAFI